MRILFVTVCLIAAFACNAFARDPISSLGSKARWLKPIPTKQWIGKSVYFMDQWRGVRGDYAPGMPRDSFVRRTAIVKSVADAGNTLVLKMNDDGSTHRMSKVKDVFRDLLLLDELERAKKFLIGKPIYPVAQQSMLYDWDSIRETGYGSRIPRFKPVKIVAIDAGYDSDNPLRITIEKPDGTTGFFFGSVSNTNRDASREYDHLMLERLFTLKDPKKLKRWPKEIWKALENNSLVKGMTPEQVRLAKANPISIEKKEGPSCDETWLFFDMATLCFRKGLLESWETVSMEIGP